MTYAGIIFNEREFQQVADLLPPETYWGDPLTAEIAASIANRAAEIAAAGNEQVESEDLSGPRQDFKRWANGLGDESALLKDGRHQRGWTANVRPVGVADESDSHPNAAPHEPEVHQSDLVMLIRRLVQALKRHDASHSLAANVLEYLRRHGLQGDPLRAEILGLPPIADAAHHQRREGHSALRGKPTDENGGIDLAKFDPHPPASPAAHAAEPVAVVEKDERESTGTLVWKKRVVLKLGDKLYLNSSAPAGYEAGLREAARICERERVAAEDDGQYHVATGCTLCRSLILQAIPADTGEAK